MICPKCSDKPTLEARVDSGGVEYDLCPSCRGMWLDAGELELVLTPAAGKAEAQGLLNPKPAPETCPRCGGALQKGGFISPALILEQCTACKGIWLDRDELRIVAKLVGAPPAAPPVAPAPAVPLPPTAAGAVPAPPQAPASVPNPQRTEPAQTPAILAPNPWAEMTDLLWWIVIGPLLILAGLFVILRPLFLQADQPRPEAPEQRDWGAGVMLIVAGVAVLAWKPSLGKMLSPGPSPRFRHARSFYDEVLPEIEEADWSRWNRWNE